MRSGLLNTVFQPMPARELQQFLQGLNCRVAIQLLRARPAAKLLQKAVNRQKPVFRLVVTAHTLARELEANPRALEKREAEKERLANERPT